MTILKMDDRFMVGREIKFIIQPDFKILIFSQSSQKLIQATRRVKELGYKNLILHTSIASSIQDILNQSPNVIVLVHSTFVKPQLIEFIKLIREYCNTSIIIWGLGLPKKYERLFLKHRRVYMLSENDNDTFINNLLRRIHEMNFSTNLWL